MQKQKRVQKYNKIAKAAYYEANKEEIKSKRRLYYLKNREVIVKNQSLYEKKNRTEKTSKERQRMQSDLNFRIRKNLRSRLGHALANDQKTGSAIKDLGCSIAEFKQYLELKFQLGMNWDNYGFGNGRWCIDHIKPLANFDLTIRENYNICCHYSNLQPMWFVDNLKKKNKEVLNEQ